MTVDDGVAHSLRDTGSVCCHSGTPASTAD
jgi:hypothetical protein